MAKAKKAKNEEQRDGDNSNSEAVVKHQKLCLSIDMDNRRIYGSFLDFNSFSLFLIFKESKCIYVCICHTELLFVLI